MSLKEKEQRAIEYLKAFEDKSDPYYLCYSGGKDSDTIRILADIAGVSYELHNNHTTVDTPTTVRYIKEVMETYGEKQRYATDEGKVEQFGEKGFIHYPQKTMWKLIEENGAPPTRIMRYCCKRLKEHGGKGRRKVTGVRWAESRNRTNNQGLVTIIGKSKTVQTIAEDNDANFRLTDKGGVVLNTDNDASRRVVEQCYRTTATLINPIIDWTDEEVWEFLHYYGCQSNPEYCNGAKRVGCIGCPMAGGKGQKQEFEKYPKYREAYVRAFEKMLQRKKEKGHQMFDISKGRYWRDGEAVMRWWVGDDPLQITFEDYLQMIEEEQ